MQTCLHSNNFETSLRPNKMCFATPIGVATHRLGTNDLDIATSNHSTEENTDHLEASSSNLSCSQDSYMRDINQGNMLHSHIELDSLKPNPQHDLPYFTTITSIPLPTCSYSPRNSPQLPFEINLSPTSSYTQLNSFSSPR